MLFKITPRTTQINMKSQSYLAMSLTLMIFGEILTIYSEV